MISKKVVRLIHSEIDGKATPHESAKLREMLEQDPEARGLFNDLSRLSAILSDTASPNPPATLKPSIMRSLDAASSRKSGEAWGSTWVRSLRVRGILRPAYVFPVGILVGMLLIAVYVNIVNRSAVPSGDASATMILHPSLGTLADRQVTNITLGQGNVAVTTGLREGISVLAFQLSTSKEVTLTVIFDPEQVNIEGVKRGGSSNGTLTIGPGSIQIVSGGDTELSFFVNSQGTAAPSVRLGLTVVGGTYQERVIPLARNDG